MNILKIQKLDNKKFQIIDLIFQTFFPINAKAQCQLYIGPMKQALSTKQKQQVPQYVGITPAGNQHHQLGKNQFNLLHGHQQQNSYSQSNANQLSATGPQGGQVAGQQNGRSASSGTNYNHKSAKSQIQPVFAMKNRKVKNASYSQQRTDRIDKQHPSQSQVNFGSQSGLQVPQNYHNVQMSQNIGSMGRDLGGTMSQFDSGNMALAGSQPLLASTVQVGAQAPVHQPIQHQYNSTQPAPGSHSGPGFAMSQSYQSLQNTKLKNQKNYQAKVQKARRLGSSHGTTNGQSQPQAKANQVATGTQSLLNFQQMPSSQSQLNNKTVMFQNYKTNVAPTNQNAMMSSSNPPSAGNSRSKSVHQQAQQNPNVYGLNNGAMANQPGNPSSSKMIETNHSSTKSHQFTNTNPIAVDPYAQSPQINFNYPQNVPIIKHPKTVKQQRSLSDQFGGRRQQQQHNVSLKQMEQAQNKKVNKQQVPSHPQIGGQLSKSNFANTNQLNSISQINQIPISTASKRMNSQVPESTNAHNPQSSSAQNNTGGNQAAMNAQSQNSNKSQKAAVGAQKMISLNAKLQGIYKQYKTVSGAANQAGPTQSGDNVLSPKDFAFLTQPQNNQKQAQTNTHSQTQKQLNQTGQIQYNSAGSHALHHEGGRNMQNRLMSYQPSAYSSAQQKAMDGIQKNPSIREKSPGGSTAGQSQSLSNMPAGQYQGTQNQTKIGGHNLKSQSMHQIPQTQTQQLYQSNKFHHFGPSMSQANFPGPLDGHADNPAKRQQQAKLGQVHSVAHLGQGDSNQQSVRVPSGKRPESLGALEGGREQTRANMTQQQLHHQRQGTPSNKHRRMSPKIQGLESHAQVDLLTQNARPSHNNNQGQGLRVGSQDFHNNVQGTHQGYNSQPFGSYQGQRHPSQDSKAQASAAPASGVNSSLSQFGTAPLMERQTQVNSYMDAKSLVGVVNAKTDGSSGLSQSIKQIPIRQVKVRNQAGSFVEASRSFNLSLKDSQALGKYEKAQTGESTTNYHHRGQSHQNGADARPDSKSITDTQSKQGYHQRKEARIPSAGKKRTASGQGLTLTKRVPSAQRLKQQIHDQQKQSNSTKQAQEDRKKDIADIKEELSGNTGAGNVFKPRSSITNVRRSRNEGKAHLPDNHGSDMLNTADNPTSAGQSTSSLYKQEQINKKFKFQEAPTNDGQKPDLPPKEEKSQELPKPLNNIDFDDHKPSKEQTKGTTPSKDMKRSKSKGTFDKEPANAAENTKDKDQDKQHDAEAGANPAGKDKKGLFAVAPTAGLSGRNLYFNQIRNEINLSESGKCKGLPDYQNAKYSNKRNGLVAGYGANTNQGIVRNYNEDRVAIILNIMKPKSKNYESQQWPKCSFFGIYDGHGGAVCADFLRDYLHQFIIKDENFPQNPIQALRNGFREAERLFMEFAESQEKEAGEIDRSGSCAVVILIIDDMCYCANTGDSRAIMSADGGEKLFLLSTDHKPTDEIEMKRIIEQGGRIYQNSQVIQTNPTLGEGGKQMVYGPHRVFPGRLSVSRTIGDIEAKIEKYEGNANVVIADPDVTAFEIKDNHDFIVIGCDGVFDKLSSKDAIHIAWQKVLMEAAKANVEKVDLQQTHQNCGHCVDGILRTSALRRTVDNVTCVVVAFDGFQKQLQKFISNNQDGTTVDVIEEIQLEPIPEYLSNTKMNQQNKKNTGPSDNSMLLLDDNQTFSESENPLIGGKNLRGPNRAADGAASKKNAGSGPDNKLLSEIAEEDDVSSVSENAANKIGGSNNKVHDGPLGRAGKGSIHSITDQSLHDADHDPASLTERDAQKDKAQMEQKRRSQIIPQHSAGRVSSNAGADEAMLKTKQNASTLESRLLDDIDVAVNVPRRSNKES